MVENTIKKIVFNRKKIEFIKEFDQEILQMQYRPTSLKYILSLFFFLITCSAIAQQGERIKLDGVVSVVGDYVILDSDIDKTIADMESQGIPNKKYYPL